jgi:hypothetical protein
MEEWGHKRHEHGKQKKREARAEAKKAATCGLNRVEVDYGRDRRLRN